jgi:hypothetical protein
MLEEAVPALWSAFHGFFTPTVLFILNVIIGTIAVTSKLARPADATDGEDAASAGAAGGANHQQQNQVRRRAGADLCRGCFLLLRIVPVIRSRWSSAFP